MFVADPDAPIAAVAERAGVNIASLYRRFASKEEVLRRLCHDGLATYVEIARRAVDALDQQGNQPWDTFATFMEEIVEADTLALTIKLAGRFRPIPEMLALARDKGLDIVYGIRSDRTTDSLLKRRTAAAYYWLMRRLAGVQVPAHAGDFRLLSRDGEEWLAAGGEALLPRSELRLPGRHNAANALAALAVGSVAGFPREAMTGVLRRFAGLPHRAEHVRDRRGVAWIDDSKGTNVGATVAAIAGLDGPLVLIAGGDGKGQDFAPLGAACRGKVRQAVLIGRDAAAVASALASACPVSFAPSLEDAVGAAAAVAQPGDTLLLSPACASLDMFRDYAHRGEAFAAAVRGLPA